jgi:hypothetical protein
MAASSSLGTPLGPTVRVRSEGVHWDFWGSGWDRRIVSGSGSGSGSGGGRLWIVHAAFGFGFHGVPSTRRAQHHAAGRLMG